MEQWTCSKLGKAYLRAVYLTRPAYLTSMQNTSCEIPGWMKHMLKAGGEGESMEDEMVGWHHQLDGYEFEQAPGVGDGQGSLLCCSPRDCKELDMTE